MIAIALAVLAGLVLIGLAKVEAVREQSRRPR